MKIQKEYFWNEVATTPKKKVKKVLKKPIAKIKHKISRGQRHEKMSRYRKKDKLSKKKEKKKK